MFVLAACGSIAGSLGCSNKPTLAKVSGIVTVDGKRVTNGVIVFETPGQRAATGVIRDGQILEVTSYTLGDGAPVGVVAVAVTSTQEVTGPSGVASVGEKEPPKATMVVKSSQVPERYNDPGTSQLTAEIKPGENVLELKLSAK